MALETTASARDDSLGAIVVATSSGAPMRSERPKSIQILCGRPMIGHVLHALQRAGSSQIAVVTASEGEWISKRAMQDAPEVPLLFASQLVDQGSAEAVLLGLTCLDERGGSDPGGIFPSEDGDLLLVPADLPLLRPEVLASLVSHHRESGAACTVLSAFARDLPVPVQGHDVLCRDHHGRIDRLVHESLLDSGSRDSDSLDTASLDSESLNETDQEVGLGVYCVRRDLLAAVIRRNRPSALDGRYVLAGIVEVLTQSGHAVRSMQAECDLSEVRPVDNRRMLADAEAELRRRINLDWLDRGVAMVDPSRTYIDVTVELGVDVTLFPGTILQGNTRVADGCEIGPDTRLDRCVVGFGSVVEKTMARLSTIGERCSVGPFAVLEPGSHLEEGTSTGPFYAAPGNG